MTPCRILIVALAVAALYACGEPRFPTHSPPVTLHSLGDEKDQPLPKGVSRVEIDPSTQTRATIVVVGSAAIFLLALLLSMRTAGRPMPASMPGVPETMTSGRSDFGSGGVSFRFTVL